MSPDQITVPSSRRFEGQTAIVTGAASGIGRATAIRLASEGASVACLDVSAEGLDDTVSALATLGAKALAMECDVTDEADVGSSVDRAAEELGRPSVLCNVAGIGGFFNSVDMPVERWDRILAVNLKGPFLMSRATLPYLLQDDGGVIVNVASTASFVGSAYSAAYCASKGGIAMLTKALAVEFSDKKVRVNAVAPGGVDTPLLGNFGLPEGGDPKHLYRIMSRMGYCTPENVAGAIAFLASDESNYTTGAILAVDGGVTA
jgi:NAD(P)-dependent dehydrogenase (short-subunit alcohol dehydrogenase family)